MSNAEKLKALKLTIDKIDKDFGKGSVMMMNEKSTEPMEVVSTGSIGLDVALGIGGLPRGRVVEIYGPESSGKTTIATHVIAEAQKKGGMCAIIDAEHAFDSNYARKLGVDVDSLLISQPDYGEQALEIADRLILSGALDVVVIDSVAALVPKGELEGEMGDSKMGLHARLMSQALRKLTATISKTNTICIFINQLREKIGVMFGNPETTTGGNALKFYASVRLDIRRMAQIKDGDAAIGNHVKVKVVKNKVAPPSAVQNSISYSGKAFLKWEKSLTWVLSSASFKKAEAGSVIVKINWVREEMPSGNCCWTIRKWQTKLKQRSVRKLKRYRKQNNIYLFGLVSTRGCLKGWPFILTR